MNEINIYGSIIDNEYEREDANDITPGIFRECLTASNKGDVVSIHINSCGGSVPAGIAIANTIKQLKSKDIKTIAVIDGVAASIASVIACACDEIQMYPSAFLMIHNPWVMTSGDAETLRKEADTLDAMKQAIMSFYTSKFELNEDELKQMMDEETWISGSDASVYKFNVNLIEEQKEFKMAASLKKSLSKFNNKSIIEKIMKNEIKNDETTEVTDTPTETVEVVETPDETIKPEEVKNEEAIPTTEEEIKKEVIEEVTEEVTEEVVEEKNEEDIEAIKKENEELKLKIAELEAIIKEKETVTTDECEKRVSGMQSTMAKKMDAMKSDYSNKISEFTNQLQAKEKELITFKDEITSLTSKLVSAKDELSKMTSAFEEKDNALKMLNCNVNVKSHIENRDIKIRKF